MEKETEIDKRKQFIKEFENMRNMAELKSLSEYSLTTPLNDKQFARMMQLKKELLGE